MLIPCLTQSVLEYLLTEAQDWKTMELCRSGDRDGEEWAIDLCANLLTVIRRPPSWRITDEASTRDLTRRLCGRAGVQSVSIGGEPPTSVFVRGFPIGETPEVVPAFMDWTRRHTPLANLLPCEPEACTTIWISGRRHQERAAQCAPLEFIEGVLRSTSLWGRIVLLGEPADSDISWRVWEGGEPPVTNLVGRTSMEEALRIAQGAKVNLMYPSGLSSLLSMDVSAGPVVHLCEPGAFDPASASWGLHRRRTVESIVAEVIERARS